MTTPPNSEPPNEPPSREAVEAAMHCALKYKSEAPPQKYPDTLRIYKRVGEDYSHVSARILAAEVQRLKAWQQQAKDEMEMYGGDMVFACLNDL